jgi:hypothetical protein
MKIAHSPSLDAEIDAKKPRLRILCISPLFVPESTSEAFCSAKMIRALMDCDIEVKVIAFGPNVSRPMPYDESNIWKSFNQKLVDYISVQPVSMPYLLFAAIRYRTINWARWVNAVMGDAIACHKEKPFDIIYSRSLPMIAHVAGFWLSKKLKLPWIANINDPWDWHLSPFSTYRMSNIERLVSNYWLRKTFHTPDLLTFPNERLRDYHLKIMHASAPIEIIPHIGYATDVTCGGEGGFHLVHAGLIGRNDAGRSPTGLLAGLKRFLLLYPEASSITKLILIGPRDQETETIIKSMELNSHVTSTGIVSFEDSLKHIKSATVCVLLEGKLKEGIFLPQKLVDYIVSKKPVLALSPSVGIIAGMLPCTWLLRADPDDEIGVASAIATFYEDFRKGTITERMPSEDVIHQFRAETVAAKFLSAISNISKSQFNPECR